MRLQIQHLTQYNFAEPVRLDQHLLRFQPRSAGPQVLEKYSLDVQPPPRGQTHHMDAEGNAVTRVWFSEPADSLRIEMRALVLLTRSNPFDFLLNDSNRSFPIHYLPAIQPLLIAARDRGVPPTDADLVAALAQRIAKESEQDVTTFLASLAQHISRFEYIRRDTGAPWSPRETLRRETGACRDFACLYLDACRSMGLAARFVSGYQLGTVDQDRRDLHAWVEVYIPGAGWRGFDPSSGLAVADRHVAVAASVSHFGASCVDGTYGSVNGSGQVPSTMTAEIDIQLTSPSVHDQHDESTTAH